VSAEGFVFQPVDVGDAEGLAHLARQHALAFARPWSAEDFDALMRTPGVLAVLARDAAGAPCGVLLIRSVIDEAEILTIGVDPARRNKGLGRRLVEEAQSLLQGLGVVELWLEVAETNAAARALYRACGFTEAGRRSGYYAEEGAPVDALVLRRALNTATH
jgi:ribosomal-protein-alanine N-acetyltransferase